MGNLRPILLIGLAFLGYMIWVQWERDYGAPNQQAASVKTTQSTEPDANAGDSAPSDLPGVISAAEAPSESSEDLPKLAAAAQPEREEQNAASTAPADLVTVHTDVLDLKIDLVGGTVVSATLLNYPVEHDKPDVKVELLQPAGPNRFVAQSGLLSRQSAPNHTSPFTAQTRTFVLDESTDELRVPLYWQSPEGVKVTKTYILRRGRYDIDLVYHVVNNSGKEWSASRYDQLQRTVTGSGEKKSFTNPGRYSFFGIGFYNPEDKFTKINFDKVKDEPYEKTASGGWLAMIQHYFFSAWIPPADEAVSYSTTALDGDGPPRYIARGVSSLKTVAPGAAQDFSSRLFVGPKLQKQLPDIAPGLTYVVNYGIFTVFAKPLFWLLSHIHDLVGNWGWSILLLTVLIKLAFFKLTEAQYKSTARMRKLQPRIEQLKERFGDDRQRLSQAMMEMYKKEKVNPLGGCLPIIVQIPIFIALYWVLLESVELRQAPFILWIDNLSARDPYFILPALNAIFMFATQRLTPMVGMDPLQQKIMTMMPLAFSIMFAFFPAGLVLYWATNAGLSLAQQVYITRKIAAAP